MEFQSGLSRINASSPHWSDFSLIQGETADGQTQNLQTQEDVEN